MRALCSVNASTSTDTRNPGILLGEMVQEIKLDTQYPQICTNIFSRQTILKHSRQVRPVNQLIFVRQFHRKVGNLYACSQTGTDETSTCIRTNKNPFPPTKSQTTTLTVSGRGTTYRPSAFRKSGALIWMCDTCRKLYWEKDNTERNSTICDSQSLLARPFPRTMKRNQFPLVFLTACSSHETPRQRNFHSAGKFQLLPIWYGKVLLYAHLQHNRRNEPPAYPRSGSFLYLFVQGHTDQWTKRKK